MDRRAFMQGAVAAGAAVATGVGAAVAIAEEVVAPLAKMEWFTPAGLIVYEILPSTDILKEVPRSKSPLYARIVRVRSDNTIHRNGELL